MVRYKRTARKGALTPAARALIRSLYGAPPPSRVRPIESEESRVVGPIVISDDEDVAAPPLHPSTDPFYAQFLRILDGDEEIPAPPLQPFGPSAPTTDPSPLASNDALWLMRVRQELADIRREVNVAHADIAKALEDNKF